MEKQGDSRGGWKLERSCYQDVEESGVQGSTCFTTASVLAHMARLVLVTGGKGADGEILDAHGKRGPTTQWLLDNPDSCELR